MDTALASSTSKVYQSGLNKFVDFCKATGCPLVMPPSEAQVAGFVAWMCLDTPSKPQGLTAGTIRTYLCALKDACARAGVRETFSTSPAIERVVRGAKKRQARPVVRRLPVTAPLLEKALRFLRQDNYDHALIRFALVLTYAALLRMGEVAPKEENADVPRQHQWEMRSADKAVYTLPVSKTDPFRQSVEVAVYRTGTPLCPITAYENMMRLKPFATKRRRRCLSLARRSPCARACCSSI